MKKSLISAAQIALMAAVMAVCSWIAVPLYVPITLQTFGVFLSLQLLGGVNGTIAILVFLLLGAVGVPVFSGFTGGISVILGPTGGYILGFVFMGLIYIFTKKLRKNTVSEIIVLAVGLLVCYAFGTVWYTVVMSMQGNSRGIGAVLLACVVPFILPDAVKLALSVIISKRVKKMLPKITGMKYNKE